MALSPEDFVRLLTPQQLELLSEFADEANLDSVSLTEAAVQARFLQAPPASKKRVSAKRAKSTPAQIIAAAQAALREKTDADKPEQVSAFEAEWTSEIIDEIEANDDQGERRLPAVPTVEEVRQLLEAAKVKKRDYLIIRMFYATGVRRSELEAAKLADFNFREQKLFVRSGKGDKDRYVLLDRDTAKMLDDFVYGRALDDPLFDIGDAAMNTVCKKYARIIGLDERYKAMGRNFSAHSLRHAFATHLWETGIDLFILRDLLGHRFLGTTRLYVAIGIGRVLKDYNAHHPLAQRDFWNEPE